MSKSSRTEAAIRALGEQAPLIAGEPRTSSLPCIHYRVAAVPIFTASNDDVIIRDEQGHSYLLASDATAPTPLDQTDIDTLGMFFEPSIDFSWHTEPELREMFYGVSETASAAHSL
jgi:hypothetical protein